MTYFHDGDPDRDDFADFTDFAILQVPDKAPRAGLVRILWNVQNRRYRLVMRDGSCSALLLNHFLLPGLMLTISGSSVAYTTEDYSGRPTMLRVQLTFQDDVTREYFQTKFQLGIRVNRILLARGIECLTAAGPVPPPRPARATRQFEPSDPLDGIIAHLTRQCGGNVHDRDVVVVTSSPPETDKDRDAAKNVADFKVDSVFCSVRNNGAVPHTRNNWICYDFKEKRVVPTHYSIRSAYARFGASGGSHMKRGSSKSPSMDRLGWRPTGGKTHST
jgi:hypothetical protein